MNSGHPATFGSAWSNPTSLNARPTRLILRAAFHAAIGLFHVHDWVWATHSDAIRALFTYKDRNDREHAVSSAETFANALEQQYPDFGRIRSIANAVKHLELRDVRPVDNAARHATDTAVHVPGAGLGGYNVGNYGYGTSGLSYAGYPRVMLTGSSDMEFFKVAEAVRQMWIDLRGMHAWW